MATAFHFNYRSVVTMFRAAVTLTNAQIKALYVTPVEIVPAQGAGKVALPQFAFFNFRWFANYTVPVDATLAITDGDGNGYLGALGETYEGATVSGLLASGANAQAIEVPFITYQDGYTNGSLDSSEFGVLEGNRALSLVVRGSANLTAGHASNTLKVTLYYTIEDL